MSKYNREDIEKSLQEGVLPKADYSNFDKFLSTISTEDIQEMSELLLVSSTGQAPDDMEEFLHHIFGLVFMNEFDVDEFESSHFDALRNQIMRQNMAEYCHRHGKWDITQENRTLVVDDQPF